MTVEAQEYVVTLRVASATGDPGEWDWGSLMDDGEAIVAPPESFPTGQEWRLDADVPPVLIDHVREPQRLLGRWVSVSWHNGKSRISEKGRLLAVKHDDSPYPHTLWLSPSPGTTRVILLEKIVALTPLQEPAK